jgi:hypothetical protein
MANHLPYGAQMWERVARDFAALRQPSWPLRDGDKCATRFSLLVRKTKSTGNNEMEPSVLRAKQIQQQIAQSVSIKQMGNPNSTPPMISAHKSNIAAQPDSLVDSPSPSHQIPDWTNELAHEANALIAPFVIDVDEEVDQIADDGLPALPALPGPAAARPITPPKPKVVRALNTPPRVAPGSGSRSSSQTPAHSRKRHFDQMFDQAANLASRQQAQQSDMNTMMVTMMAQQAEDRRLERQERQDRRAQQAAQEARQAAQEARREAEAAKLAVEQAEERRRDRAAAQQHSLMMTTLMARILGSPLPVLPAQAEPPAHRDDQ